MPSKPYLHKTAMKFPLYPGKFIIILSNDRELIDKQFQYTFEDPEPFAHSIASNYKGYNGYFLVLNFNHSFASVTHGTIAHEAVHTAMYLCEEVGIELDHDNPEPLTYLVDWITDEVYKFIEKKNFKTYLK